MKSKTRFHRRKSPHEKATRLMSERSRGKPPDSLTRRKHGEKPLRESEAHYRMIFDNANDAIFIRDLHGRFLEVNQVACDRYGYSRDELLKMSTRNIDSPESEVLIAQRTKELLKTGHEILESTHVRRDGKIIPVEMSRRLITFRGRQAILGIARDITERKQVEQALHRSEERIRGVLGALPDLVFEISPEGLFMDYHAQIPSDLAHPPEEFLGKSIRSVLPLTVAALIEAAMTAARTTGAVQTVEYQLPRLDGRPADWEARIVSLSDGTFIDVVRNITEGKMAEEKLRRSVERYQSLFDRMLDGVYRTTHEGRFVEVNSAFVKMFGYSTRQEIMGIDIRKELYFSAEERGSHLLDTGQEEVEAYRMRRKDGSEIWVEDHGHYVHDEQGNIIYHEGILRDITERKQFEKSLLALNRHALQLNSATNMEDIIEYTLDAMQLAFGFDFGDVLIVEDGSLRIKGSRGKESTISQLPLNGRGLAVLAANKKSVIRVSDTRKEDAYVDRMGFDWQESPTMLSELAVPLIMGGEVVAVLNVESERLDAFKHEDEELLETLASYVASAMNRLKRDEALRESVSLHRATLESTAEGILVVDMNGKVTSFNQSFAELWRIPANLLETRDDSKLLHFVVDKLEDPQKFLDKVQELYSKPEKESFDVLRFKDGREFERYSRPQRLGTRIVGRVWSFRDVTERLTAIGETAAMVGHDLRNPLQAISTATYVLKKELTPSAAEKTREMFEVIEDSVAYSDRIVRDLLEYSQKLELELSEATPKLIASDAVRQVEIPKNIIVSDLTSDEPKIRVDTTKIRRIFVNLIEDAVDAMPDGGKLTIVSNRSDDFLIVKFADTGPGIAETVLRDLWKPLITTKPKGIGLGLAICKRIAEAHGGSITVESKIGEGTTFTLRLPISHSQEGAQRA